MEHSFSYVIFDFSRIVYLSSSLKQYIFQLKFTIII